MGTVVHLSDRVGPGRTMDRASGADLFQRCSDLIGATIAERIHEIGGTDRDVEQISTAVAYTLFVWSAADLNGG